MPWWVDMGYPPFDEGRDGFPRTGQVIKHYRRQRRDEKGKVWTQSDLAHVLNIQKQAVIKMENHDTEIDTGRRKFLCEVLGIPPLLLSVRTLEEVLQEATKNGKVPDLTAIGSGTDGAIDVEEHQRYLTTAKTTYQHASQKGILENVNLRMDSLYRELPHMSSHERDQIHALLFDYHLLAAALLARKQEAGATVALRHIDRGTLFAHESSELQVACLLRKGHTLKEMGNFKETLVAFEAIQLHAKKIPDSLHAVSILYLAPILAKVGDKRTALSLIERAGEMTRTLPKDYTHCFDFSVQRYHLAHAEVLSSIGRNRDALDELALVQCKPVSWWQVHQNALEAQAYFNLGMHSIAVSCAEAALSSIKAFDSDQRHLAHVQAIHRQLCSSPYKNSPDVARLGYMLRS
jgi:hypothetical protein